MAINLLVHLTAENMVCQYVSKNSAPRNVYSALLRARDRTMTYINGLFRGPGKFYELEPDSLDAIVVDEAHRLNEKSGFYGNEGEYTDDLERLRMFDTRELFVEGWPPVMHVWPGGFEAALTALDGTVLRVNHEGRLW